MIFFPFVTLRFYCKRKSRALYTHINGYLHVYLQVIQALQLKRVLHSSSHDLPTHGNNNYYNTKYNNLKINILVLLIITVAKPY